MRLLHVVGVGLAELDEEVLEDEEGVGELLLDEDEEGVGESTSGWATPPCHLPTIIVTTMSTKPTTQTLVPGRTPRALLPTISYLSAF